MGKGEGFQPGFHVGAGRDDHDGNRPGLGVAAQTVAQTNCIAVRQGHGRYDEIRFMTQRGHAGLIRGGGLYDLVKSGGEFDFQNDAICGNCIDDENFTLHSETYLSPIISVLRQWSDIG